MLLLHWGHHNNLLWSWQVQFTVTLALTGAIAALLVARGRAWVRSGCRWSGGC